MFQRNTINTAAFQGYQRNRRRRLPRYHARVCRTSSLSAARVQIARCA